MSGDTLVGGGFSVFRGMSDSSRHCVSNGAPTLVVRGNSGDAGMIGLKARDKRRDESLRSRVGVSNSASETLKSLGFPMEPRDSID